MKTCQELEIDLLAVARRESISAEVKKIVLEHTEDCLSCSQKLASERVLTEELAALKQADTKQVLVPHRLELALLQEFRRTMATVPAKNRRGARRWRITVAAAVAAIVALVAMAGRSRMKPVPKLITSSPQIATLSPPSLPEKEPIAPQKTTRTTTVAPVRPFRPPRVAVHTAQQAGKEDSDFFVFPYAPALEEHESAEIYRVRMPRATLTGLGLPPGGRLDESVEADLVIGPDGVARGIRLIR
jgi:hypothetical protein